MTAQNDFHVAISEWLVQEAGRGAPDYLDEILVRTTRTRQRPAWSSTERWFSASVTPRTFVDRVPRQAWLVALVVVLVLAAALLLLSGIGQHRRPALEGMANGQIVFVDGGLIRIADAEGVVGPVVTRVPDGAEELTFSPDGLHLAFRTLAAGSPSIALADPDGSHAVLVDAGDSATGEPIAWSPDSRQIAFVSSTANIETIVIADADGTHRRPLPVDATVAPLDPAWSPDGTWIAFFSGTDGSPAVSLIHPDGTGLRVLSTPPVDRDGLGWSPDPSRLRLTFKAEELPQSSSSRGPGPRHVFVEMYDLPSATETPLAETSILGGTFPVWSTDGTRVAWWNDGIWTAGLPDPQGRQADPISIFPSVDGGCSEHADLAGKAVCGPARWSPDGRWLFGTGIGGAAIVFGRADGSGSTHAITLSAVAGQDVAAWQPVVP